MGLQLCVLNKDSEWPSFPITQPGRRQPQPRHSCPLGAHLTGCPPHLVPTQGPGKVGLRLTLQHKDHHFLHRAQLILRQALVSSRVVLLWVGMGAGAWHSGEEDKGAGSIWGQLGTDRGTWSMTHLTRRSLEHKPARGPQIPPEGLPWLPVNRIQRESSPFHPWNLGW